jgi:hypothetical protein
MAPPYRSLSGIGLRARMVSKSGPRTRIEVVTEGVFTRMILDDPELSGIAAVLFDEFHERSLDADLGLALALDCQGSLRDDLRILPMSATLDGARVAQLLGQATVIGSEGRAFPVETRYLGRDASTRIEDQMAHAVMQALRAESGSILAFVPGQGEIRRVEEQLKERISDPSIVLAPLYGAMDIKAQDLALEPAPEGMRKVVLATSIAETSITIVGVRVVIDSGLARVPRFEPDVALRGSRPCVLGRRRSAPGAGRPDRARRVLSPVGRVANAQSARLRGARNSLGRPCSPIARLRGMGNDRPSLAVLARSATGSRHRRCAQRAYGAGGARRRRAHDRQTTAVAAARLARMWLPLPGSRPGGGGDRSPRAWSAALAAQISHHWKLPPRPRAAPDMQLAASWARMARGGDCPPTS